MLLRAEPGAGPAARAAAVRRVDRAVAGVDGLSLPRTEVRQGEARLQRTGTALMAVRSELSTDEQTDAASTLRSDLDPGTTAGGVTTYMAGQASIWAGMQELSKKDLAEAEAGGFPIVALILLVVFGSLAAAALPLALGFVSVMITGALIYFISLNDIDLRHDMASMIGIGVAIDYSLFILARYRQERRAGPRPRRRRAPGAGHLGPGGDVLRDRRDRLPRGALDGRQPGAALDGAGRDDRRRRLDPYRDHPAPRPDRLPRRPRDAGRDRGTSS